MKLDTGMHRRVRPEEAEAFYQRLSQCKNVRQPVNVVTTSRAPMSDLRRHRTPAGHLHHLYRRQAGLALYRRLGRYSAVAAIALRLGTPGIILYGVRRWTIAPPGKISAASR